VLPIFNAGFTTKVKTHVSKFPTVVAVQKALQLKKSVKPVSANKLYNYIMKFTQQKLILTLFFRALFHTSVFSLLSNTCISQINYTKLKKNQSFWQCGMQNKIEAEKKLRFLDSIAQFDIKKGKNHFLYDFGMTNYIMFLFTKDTSLITKSINAFYACYDKTKDVDVLFNLFICYGLISDCENQNLAANQLKRYAVKKKYSYLELNQPFTLSTKCN
jgi:hypothetical protein